jgi:hypothetical protein
VIEDGEEAMRHIDIEKKHSETENCDWKGKSKPEKVAADTRPLGRIGHSERSSFVYIYTRK